MKWSPLQLNMLPLIAIETDDAIKHYKSLIETVTETACPQDIQQLNNYRQSIKKRITVLDRFYQRKSQNQTISLFHMLKLKLEKAIYLNQHIDQNSMSSEAIFNLLPHGSNSSTIDRNHNNYLIKEKFDSNEKVSQNQFSIVKKKKINELASFQKEKYRKMKTQHSEISREILINDDFKNQQISHHKNIYNDNSYDDYEPLFTHDPQPIVNQQKSINQQRPVNQQKLINTQKKYPKTLKTHQPESQIKANLKKGLEQKKQLLGNNSNISKSYRSMANRNNQTKKTNNRVKDSILKLKNSKQKQIGRNKSSKAKSFLKNQQMDKPYSKTKSDIKEDHQQEQAQQVLNSNDFRFTIKMTKQEYMNLLAMKQQLEKNVHN